METLVAKPTQTRDIILRAAQVKRPIFVWGPPGIGKSDVVAGVAEQLGNAYLIDLRLALMEPTDLRGFPFRNPETNQMEWAPPQDLPTAELAAQYDHVLLFLDEMNSAPPSVQAAAYQLVLNRRIGAYHLPDNVIIVAAGNRENDRGVTYRMPAPLANRFRHINMNVDFADWQRWAINAGINADVIGYLSHAKGDLFDFEPGQSSQAFATPRSWAFVSEMLNLEGFDGDTSNAEVIQRQILEISGAIGEGLARKFIEHRRVAEDLPHPADIMTGNVTKLASSLEKEIAVKYSLVVKLTYELAAIHKESGMTAEFKEAFNHAIRFAYGNFQPEMVILMFKTIMTDYKIKFNVRTDLDKDVYQEFADRYVKFIV